MDAGVRRTTREVVEQDHVELVSDGAVVVIAGTHLCPVETKLLCCALKLCQDLKKKLDGKGLN